MNINRTIEIHKNGILLMKVKVFVKKVWKERLIHPKMQKFVVSQFINS